MRDNPAMNTAREGNIHLAVFLLVLLAVGVFSYFIPEQRMYSEAQEVSMPSACSEIGGEVVYDPGKNDTVWLTCVWKDTPKRNFGVTSNMSHVFYADSLPCWRQSKR